MKTIIRIEHECGNGLFTARTEDDSTAVIRKSSFVRKLQAKHMDFPVPQNDGLTIRSCNYCAFKSIEQIQQWIEPEQFKEIIELGFKIWMIDVADYQEGEYQILFKKQDILSKKDISQLFINKVK